MYMQKIIFKVKDDTDICEINNAYGNALLDGVSHAYLDGLYYVLLNASGNQYTATFIEQNGFGIAIATNNHWDIKHGEWFIPKDDPLYNATEFNLRIIPVVGIVIYKKRIIATRVFGYKVLDC